MMSYTYSIDTIKELEKVVLQFLPPLNSKEVVWLTGPLGIGKSEWVRLSLKHLGFSNYAPSPSFSIQNSYVVKNNKIHHIDLYRIESEADLNSIDFFDLFLEKTGCIFVEWADRIALQKKFLNWNQLSVHFNWQKGQRIVHIKKWNH